MDQDVDIDALQAERDELRAELAARDRRARVGGKARTVAVAALVVVSVVAFLAAALGIWAERNVLDTDRYVEHVAPLAEDPAVQDTLAQYLTDQIMEVLDPAAFFAEAFPERGALLAVPLTGAVEDFVHGRVRSFVATERFADLWRGANERAHRRIVQVLRGEAPRLEAAADSVTIDLIPIVNAALAEVGEASPELLGRTVDLPTLTTDDIPDEARARLADALGVPIDDDFGEITVYERGRLRAAQDGLEMFERFRVLSIVVTIVAVVLALLLSRRRRRTLLQLTAGFGIGLVLIRRVALALQSEITDLVRVPANRPAVDAVVAVFVDPLVDAAGWILLGLAVIALVAVATGPYPWVVNARHAVRRAVSQGPGSLDAAWVSRHEGLLTFGALALLAVVLWQANLSWAGALVAVSLFGVFALAVDRVAASASPDDANPDDGVEIDLREPDDERVESHPDRLANHP